MAKFDMELPNDLLKEFEQLNVNTEKMLGEMTQKSAEYVKGEIERRTKIVFRNSNEILKGLKITRVYKTKGDDGINTKVAFYGYMPTKDGKTFKMTKKLKGGKKANYEYEGVPIPLVVAAREYGSKSGEQKKPFIRPSFNKNKIREIMERVQAEYLPKE